MSTRITEPEQLEPVAAGSDCSVCWGIDKPFGDGGTPEKIFVILENIEKGPNWNAFFGEPPNGEYECSQGVSFPCQFLSPVVPGAKVTVLFSSGQTDISVITGLSFPVFTRTASQECLTVLGNEEDNLFTGGTATIRIPETT